MVPTIYAACSEADEMGRAVHTVRIVETGALTVGGFATREGAEAEAGYLNKNHARLWPTYKPGGAKGAVIA